MPEVSRPDWGYFDSSRLATSFCPTSCTPGAPLFAKATATKAERRSCSPMTGRSVQQPATSLPIASHPSLAACVLAHKGALRRGATSTRGWEPRLIWGRQQLQPPAPWECGATPGAWANRSSPAPLANGRKRRACRPAKPPHPGWGAARPRLLVCLSFSIGQVLTFCCCNARRRCSRVKRSIGASSVA